MSWLQVAVLIAVLAVLFEITFRRIKALLVIRGWVEDAVTAVAGRVTQVEGTVKKLDTRLEVVERELKLR